MTFGEEFCYGRKLFDDYVMISARIRGPEQTESTLIFHRFKYATFTGSVFYYLYNKSFNIIFIKY